jgi:hypothetical protein
LLSDFGLKDPYVAEMKAVISTISPEAKIIDISHSIEKFNIRMGAFVLASASRYFPKGTVHVGVVDPSVGTNRRALLVETEHAFYIGPDNGLLTLGTQSDKIQHVYAITNTRLMLPYVSFTFHGRDVFAPAAAHLANGTLPADFGTETMDYVIPTFAAPVSKGMELTGEVLHIDDFGNIITNITSKNLEKIEAKRQKFLTVRLMNKTSKIRFCKAYGDVTAKDMLALIGSHDFLEISVNQGNASKKLKTKAGDALTVSLER